MKELNWTGIILVSLVVGIICVIVGYNIAPSGTTGLTSVEVNTKVSKAVEQALINKNAEIETLKGLIGELENKTAEDEITDEDKILIGYVLDEVLLREPVIEILSDREVNLFDGEVEFDGDNYDAEEVFNLTGLLLLANENDFEGVPYLTVPRGTISYVFEFEKSLNTSEINNKETLIFNLLGDRYEVSEWNEDGITLTKGTEYKLEVEEVVEVGGKEVLLDAISEDSEKVYVEVNGVGKSIEQGKTKIVNGLEIKVNDVFYSGTYAFASLTIGEKIEVEIDDEDEYEKDSIWEWVIDNHSIGLVLVEDFDELDEDEDYNALAPGESICLPNDYLCVVYNGVIEEDREVYTFELDERDDFQYVEVNGNFLSGINDYSRIYINLTGIYDRDLELISNESIELGDTTLELVLGESWIKVGNTEYSEEFKVNYDLNETNDDIEDENYLTDYGILVENPKDSIEDESFTITVPEEKLEATISVN